MRLLIASIILSNAVGALIATTASPISTTRTTTTVGTTSFASTNQNAYQQRRRQLNQTHHSLSTATSTTRRRATSSVVLQLSKTNGDVHDDITSNPLKKKKSPRDNNNNKNTSSCSSLSSSSSECDVVLHTCRGGASAETPKKRSLKSWELAGAGALATMIGDVTMHPIDCIKTLQQSSEGRGLNMLSASHKIFSQYGPSGFFNGVGTYVVSDGMAGAVKFASYEAMKTWVNDRVPEKYQGPALFGIAAVAFIASSVVLVPGELIKQRLQMGQITSVAEGFTQIWNTDGPLGFYRGYAGVCLRDVPYTMMELGIYDNIKRFYLKMKSSSEGEEVKISQMDELVAAAIAGGITGLLTNPLDTIKTKLMVNPEMYTGFMDCLQQNIAQDGIGTLFAGAAARVSWIMPFTAIYLPLYETIKRKLETLPVGSSPKTIVSAFVPSFGMSPSKNSSSQKLLAMKGGAASSSSTFEGSNNILYPTPTISDTVETTTCEDVQHQQQQTRNHNKKTYRLDGKDSFVTTKNAFYVKKGSTTKQHRDVTDVKTTKRANTNQQNKRQR